MGLERGLQGREGREESPKIWNWFGVDYTLAAFIRVEAMATTDRSFWKDHRTRCQASSPAPICCATLSKSLNLSEIEFFHIFERDHYMFLNHLN